MLSTETGTDIEATLAAVAAYGLAGSRRALPTEPLGTQEWQTLLAEVGRERLAGLLGAAIANGAFAATDEQAAQAGELEMEIAAVALFLERLLLVVAESFAAADLEFRVLKGPAVAHLDYSDPAQRCFGDLDLLVRAGDFTRAVAVLEAAGGNRSVPELRRGFDERFGKGAMIAMSGELEIDLHRSFAAGPLAMTIDLDGLFTTSTPFTIGDRQLAGLGTEERFLHACIHAGVGRPAGLHALRDVAEMALGSSLDVDRVRRLSDAWRATAVVTHAIDLAWTTLDLADSVAVSAWASTYRPDRNGRRLLDAYVGGDQSYTRQALATLRVIPRVREKAAYARSLLLPQRRYLDARRASRFGYVRSGSAHLRWGIPR